VSQTAQFISTVLNDVYQYHLPPVRRIPPLLWTRVRGDLAHYFTERAADGTTVISWYHRQFAEVSRERYLRNVNVLMTTHALVADYFLGVWGGGVRKPFEYTELQRQRFFLDTTQGECDRKVKLLRSCCDYYNLFLPLFRTALSAKSCKLEYKCKNAQK
jgi:hypothetical protein